VVSGAALALGGGASLWLGPATPLAAVLAVSLLFGIAVGMLNPPITNTAVSGMPASMAGVAASLASAGRQAGTTLGVAISGTIVGSALARGGTAFTGAAHGVWWLILGLGIGIAGLGLLSSGRWALGTAERAATLFEGLDRGRGSSGRRPGRPPVISRAMTPGRTVGGLTGSGEGALVSVVVRVWECSVAITGGRTSGGICRDAAAIQRCPGPGQCHPRPDEGSITWA
jgi:MFS family permease